MDPDWTPICLIPHEDMPRFGAQAPKGYKLVSFVTAKNKFSFADCAKGEEELDADMVFRDAVARCHSTARGQAELQSTSESTSESISKSQSSSDWE